MKIAMVSTRELPAWEHEHVAGLSAALTALRHDVTVHVLDATDAESGTESPALGEFVESLREEWSWAQPDVVHAHSWRAGLASVLAAQRLALPVVQTFHGVSPDSGQATVERLIGKEAALVVASCEQELLDLAAAGIPRPRIVVAPRGVDTGVFRPDGEITPGTLAHRVVAIADPPPHRGVADLVAALPLLEDVELVVADVPDPRAANELKAWARRFGVHNRTRVLRPDAGRHLPALLRSADVAAFAPRQTWWDDAPLKAMACGAPVVATEVGGLSDAVVDGVTGVLVASDDLKQLVKTLRKVLKDEVFLESCAIAAVDRIAARHSWGVVGRCFERLYSGLAQRPADASAG
ncbi:glycosyltransferase [Lentzea sp. NBRC 102530]|uniref:glycosyltransferase n=1 Tax=Lentzea sp. NBRC 102530 TaxID=3032201 RepID=UPI0024A053EE|nr:glycosyltransferase [Lentzea sp. NBRC 102530]GLY50371.1 glycosyl transferase [Lentzea sp. NBRC 102530]